MFAISLNDYIVAQLKREADLELLQRASHEQNTSKQTRAVNTQWVGKMPKCRLAKVCFGDAWHDYEVGCKAGVPPRLAQSFSGKLVTQTLNLACVMSCPVFGGALSA